MVALKKVPAVFYQTKQGARPVRDFILGLPREDRRIIGNDIATVEYSWPVGKPTCAPLGLGPWEVRSSLASSRQQIPFVNVVMTRSESPSSDKPVRRRGAPV